MKHQLQRQLTAGIAELKLSVSEVTQLKMLAFLEFLQRWNRAYNLTAVAELDNMVTRHLLDSLAILPYLKGNHILDVGTGAGFPGIPLAMACPEKRFVLLDSSGKKTRFLLQALASFKLSHVEVVQVRMESFRSNHCFDDITCRAVGPMSKVIDDTKRLICDNGQWLLMKGACSDEELRMITYPSVTHELSIPGLTAKRYLVVATKKNRG